MKKYKLTVIANKKIWLVVLLLVANQLLANFQINKFTINSGGSKITGQKLQLTSSIAQTSTNNVLTSSSFSLSPGFWQKNNDLIYTNNFK